MEAANPMPSESTTVLTERMSRIIHEIGSEKPHVKPVYTPVKEAQKHYEITETVHVRLLRSFSIEYKRINVVRRFSKFPKSSSLLKYLILNRDRPVTSEELIKTFWEPDQHNPEGSLKTLISRMRSSLGYEYPELKDCIVTGSRTYRWNPNIPCDIDAFTFEKKCTEIFTQEHVEDWEQQFKDALDIYMGNLDTVFEADACIKSWAFYFKQIYVKLVGKYIAYLKEDKKYSDIIGICREAIGIEAFDDNLNIELMNALGEENQSKDAVFHYQKIMELGDSPKMLSVYNDLVHTDLSVREELSAICGKYNEKNGVDHALICDNSVFCDIYQIQLRNLKRMGTNLILAMLMVDCEAGDGGADSLALDHVMQDLLATLKRRLHKGDIVTRYSSSQYMIMMLMPSIKSAEDVIIKIRRSFYKDNHEHGARIAYHFEQITGK